MRREDFFGRDSDGIVVGAGSNVGTTVFSTALGSVSRRAWRRDDVAGAAFVSAGLWALKSSAAFASTTGLNELAAGLVADTGLETGAMVFAGRCATATFAAGAGFFGAVATGDGDCV